MKQTWKQIGSLFLSVCMVVTMLPVTAFAETGTKDSGAGLGASGEITAFAALDEDIAVQTVDLGTAEDELNLPKQLKVTVTKTVTTTTGSAVTATVSGDDTATGSEAKKQEQQEETKEITEETTVDVTCWTSDQPYDGDVEGDYVFTSTLELPGSLTLAVGVDAPTLTVTVGEDAAVPQARGAAVPFGAGTNITSAFTDAYFLAAVRTALGKDASDPIYDTDVASVTILNVYREGISSLAGLEYFTALTALQCGSNLLTELPALPSSLTALYCGDNKLTSLPTLPSSLTELSCSDNNLTALPALPSSLTTLICGNNSLASLPALPSSLTTLYCDNNKLTSLPELPSSLTKLYCGGNKLMTALPTLPSGLTKLYCDYNSLTSLPTLPSTLTELSCDYNSLTSLPTLPSTLTELICNGNKLTGITLNGSAIYTKINVSKNYMTATNAVTGQSIDWRSADNTSGDANFVFYPQKTDTPPTDITAKFTDDYFLEAVRTALGKSASDPIYDTDVASVTTLDVSREDIASLAGLEYFTALTTLDCSTNDLAELPTLPTGLTTLDCSTNDLTKLPTLPSSLTVLDCEGNGLTTLPELPSSLEVLICSTNSLTSLPKLPSSLTKLYCMNNKLTSVALHGSATYAHIDVSNNNMTATSAVTGQSIDWLSEDNISGDNRFIFYPQKAQGGPIFYDADISTFNLANLPTAEDASGGSRNTAWTWNSKEMKLMLYGKGPYTLAGTARANMSVSTQGSNIDLTLSGASFAGTAPNTAALYFSQHGTLKVTADSEISGYVSASRLDIILDSADLKISGPPTTTPALWTRGAEGLTLSGNGTVTVISSEGTAVSCGYGDLTVGSGCTLSASGESGIQVYGAISGARTISGGGTIKANGSFAGITIIENGTDKALAFDFSGNLEMSGKVGVLMLVSDSAGPATVAFIREPASLNIRGDYGIIGGILQSTGKSVTVELQNTANIPDLTEAFHAGEKVFSTGGPVPIPTKASISGTIKGNDTNSGMSGVTVQLKNTSGGLLATTTTDASGQYSFDDLLVGTYRIEASAAGYRSGTLSNIVLETANISGKDITLTKTSGDSGGDSGDGGGSSGGGSSSSTTPPATVTSPNVDPAGAVNQTAITGEAAAALSGAAPGGTAVVRTQNASSITPAVLSALANAAEGKNIVLHADTMSGNAVQGRIYVDPAKLADVKEPIKLGVYTESGKTSATTAIFERFFDNNVATVSFEQQGSLGARLEVAAKVDLTGMDVTKLVLYSYDKATNTYRRIENPAYWVDKNGYLHFNTALAGDIIISEGPLTLKNGGVK